MMTFNIESDRFLSGIKAAKRGHSVPVLVKHIYGSEVGIQYYP